MKLCENCNTLEVANFGSKRFCSISCSRSFSTKFKRAEINEKVKKKLTLPLKELTCIECSSKFNVHSQYKTQEFCSKQCAAINRNKNPLYTDKLSKSMIKAHIEGRMQNSIKSVKCYYEYNNDKIRCDSKVEYACLDFFIKTYNVLSIKRSTLILKYEYNLKIKNYLPDFEIETTIGTFIVECKCFFKITESVKKSKSWTLYYDTIELKRIVLKEYCKVNGFIEFFFQKELHRKFYDNCYPNIDI